VSGVLLLLVFGCAPSTERVSPVEVYDVPPPPGARTVSFELSWQPALGAEVAVRGATTVSVDVVDVSETAPFTVTGYAPEDGAMRLLEGGAWTVRRP
jgi:hypothetical protein